VHTSDLAVRIGRWAVGGALSGLAEIRRAVGRPELFVAVNISPRELDQDDFSEIVLGVLASHGLPTESLVLEITEEAIVADLKGASTRLTPLRRAGVRVAIDDFGTGFSSLNYLGRLPADMLKIPKQFVDGLPTDERTAQVVAKMIDLCGGLALDVVAEGIERAEQAAALEAMGCVLGQGFHFASPRSLHEITEFLAPGPARSGRGSSGRIGGPRTSPRDRILGGVD
jgi:EAL domain-containing protein (putative c-di-GMP-specific phosphodiesterase class I)